MATHLDKRLVNFEYRVFAHEQETAILAPAFGDGYFDDLIKPFPGIKRDADLLRGLDFAGADVTAQIVPTVPAIKIGGFKCPPCFQLLLVQFFLFFGLFGFL